MATPTQARVRLRVVGLQRDERPDGTVRSVLVRFQPVGDPGDCWLVTPDPIDGRMTVLVTNPALVPLYALWSVHDQLIVPVAPAPSVPPPPPPPPAPTPDGTKATSVTDSTGHAWSLGAAGVTLRDGQPWPAATPGAGVTYKVAAGRVYVLGIDDRTWFAATATGWSAVGTTEPV